jgi:PhnB protein
MKKHAYIPEGYNAVMPALAIKNATAAIEWYEEVFGAKEKMRFNNPDGTIAHSEITIGDTVVMVSEENPQYNKSPKTLNGNSVNLCVYVQDVDAVVKKAIDSGANILIPVADQFYGDRSGRIEDPFGYIWIVSTHIKDVSEEEMKKAMDEMMQQQA